MKTKPAKILMGLLLGLGSVALASSPAFADESKESKDSKDSKNSSVSASSAKCTGQLITACGLKVVKTTCIGSTVASTAKSEEADDDKHKSKDKDSKSKNDRDYNDDSHRDHADRSHDSEGSKVSICHRMGGAEVSLTVANDGWLSGHSKHALDTIGRCADFDAAKDSDDSKEDKDRDHKISASDAGYGMGMTTTQVACLKGSTGSNFTINGTSYPGAGLNSGNFSISVQSAAQGPSRGGARTLH